MWAGVGTCMHSTLCTFLSILHFAGQDIFLNQTSLEILPNMSFVSVYASITDDSLAEDSETTELLVMASINNNLLAQQSRPSVTIHDNEGLYVEHTTG
jgi:hypothetical protein